MSHPSNFGPDEFQKPTSQTELQAWNDARNEHFIDAQIDLMNRMIFVSKNQKTIPEKKSSRTPYFKGEGERKGNR